MNQCSRCQGFVPDGEAHCPNCRSTRRWWAIPLSFLGAGAASVTLSACYGAPCASRLPDGGYDTDSCIRYDCDAILPDGGVRSKDPDWVSYCADHVKDGGGDAGTGGGRDGGTDGGSDAGP